jgi:hypothetical protein
MTKQNKTDEVVNMDDDDMPMTCRPPSPKWGHKSVCNYEHCGCRDVADDSLVGLTKKLCQEAIDAWYAKYPDCFIHHLDIANMANIVVYKLRATDAFLAGLVDPENNFALFYNASLEEIKVPLSFFVETGKAQPNFTEFDLIEDGKCVRFGSYEIDSKAIICEFDPLGREQTEDNSPNTKTSDCAESSCNRNCCKGCGCGEIPIELMDPPSDLSKNSPVKETVVSEDFIQSLENNGARPKLVAAIRKNNDKITNPSASSFVKELLFRIVNNISVMFH